MMGKGGGGRRAPNALGPRSLGHTRIWVAKKDAIDIVPPDTDSPRIEGL